MLRTRLLSFTLGFTVAGAAISNFIWKDLFIDRSSLYSEMKQKFDALETRIGNLESIVNQTPESIKDDG